MGKRRPLRNGYGESLRGSSWGRLARGMREGSTVLVVDDEPAIRLLCRVNLEFEGYDVLEAGTFAQAREQLEAADVDVVLLDVHVAGEDGRDFFRELNGRGRRPAVAYLSGSIDIDRGGEGAEAVVLKPFQLDELTSTVARLADLAPVG
jgi:DNA-binding response OmpR family regulator